MKTCTNLIVIAGIAALSAFRPAFADDAPKKEETKPDAIKQHVPHPFLGVFVSSVHPALAHNLGEMLNPEQGLIVEEFLADSPAAKAGIKMHDILMTYDDQKLLSAEQFVKLVHSDKVGREVTMGYLRGGKLHKTQVTLGDAPDHQHHHVGAQASDTTPRWLAGPRQFWNQLHFRHTPHKQWENFDSLNLKKLGDDKFRAEVHYLDKAGKAQQHVFEGTREEIKKAIDAKKDLKPIERDHLLRSLNLPNHDGDVSDFDAF